MWLTVIIGIFFFLAAAVAALAFGYQRIEQERRERSEAVLAHAPAAKPGRCMLCDAPLRQLSTADQGVYEVEHRIDAELHDVIQLLGRAGPDGLARLYRA